jgi:hypothetical protein
MYKTLIRDVRDLASLTKPTVMSMHYALGSWLHLMVGPAVGVRDPCTAVRQRICNPRSIISFYTNAEHWFQAA